MQTGQIALENQHISFAEAIGTESFLFAVGVFEFLVFKYEFWRREDTFIVFSHNEKIFRDSW